MLDLSCFYNYLMSVLSFEVSGLSCQSPAVGPHLLSLPYSYYLEQYRSSKPPLQSASWLSHSLATGFFSDTPIFACHVPSLSHELSLLTASLCTKSCAPASSVCFTRQESPASGVLHAHNLGGGGTCQLSGQDESPKEMLAVASLATLKDDPFLGVREEPVPAGS